MESIAKLLIQKSRHVQKIYPNNHVYLSILYPRIVIGIKHKTNASIKLPIIVNHIMVSKWDALD